MFSKSQRLSYMRTTHRLHSGAGSCPVSNYLFPTRGIEIHIFRFSAHSLAVELPSVEFALRTHAMTCSANHNQEETDWAWLQLQRNSFSRTIFMPTFSGTIQCVGTSTAVNQIWNTKRSCWVKDKNQDTKCWPIDNGQPEESTITLSKLYGEFGFWSCPTDLVWWWCLWCGCAFVRVRERRCIKHFLQAFWRFLSRFFPQSTAMQVDTRSLHRLSQSHIAQPRTHPLQGSVSELVTYKLTFSALRNPLQSTQHT